MFHGFIHTAPANFHSLEFGSQACVGTSTCAFSHHFRVSVEPPPHSQSIMHDTALGTTALLESSDTVARRRARACQLAGLLLIAVALGFIVVSVYALIDHYTRAPIFAPQSFSKSSSNVIRGVNLGGWLVLEPWITPSLFFPYLCSGGCPPDKPPVIDERSLCDRLGSAAGPLLEKFRSEWVNESTFKSLAAAGLNTVRIPYGYWIFGDAPEFCPNVSSIHHLDNAIEWSNKYGLNVILDLHGVPYSQNGQDNSGTSLKGPYSQQRPKWGRPPFNGSAWLAPNHLAVTRRALQRVASRYANRSSVIGMGMVNEWMGMWQPWCDADCPLGVDRALGYFKGSWEAVQPMLLARPSAVPPINPIVDMGEGSSPDSWIESSIPPSLTNGTLDLHVYQAWYGNGLSDVPQEQHLRDAGCGISTIISDVTAQTRVKLMVGEWSTAMTNCMIWLNGVGLPSEPATECSLVACPNRFGELAPNATDAAGFPTADGLCPVGRVDESGLPSAPKGGPLTNDEYYHAFTQAAMSSYETSAGWTFWNFDNEMGDPRWSFFEARRLGWFPANLSIDAYTPPTPCCERACVPVVVMGTASAAWATLGGSVSAALVAVCFMFAQKRR